MNSTIKAFLLVLSALLVSLVSGAPSPSVTHLLERSFHPRQTAQPYFPTSIPSCPICGASYANISSCAAAAPVLANYSQILFDPSGFIAVIECSCTDTFQAAYPQCVDCFQQTNQTQLLQSNNLPSVVQGLRTVCGMVSALLGGVASTDRELPSDTATALSSTATSAALSRLHSLGRGTGIIPALLCSIAGFFIGIALLL